MTMWDHKDQKTVERLRTERQAKIDELKERTNYYTTQQLIQRYDPDPAAKAAAATVLASKLGADSGLKVYLGDENATDSAAERSNDAEYMHSTGLRQRKQGHNNSHSTGGVLAMQSAEGELTSQAGTEGQRTPPQTMHHPTVEHYQPQGLNTGDGGWIAKLAALLVGEDPIQSYALVCGNCHMHNGLARKEDFPYITYYCPHCHALNKSKLSPDISAVGSPSSVHDRSVGSDVGNKLLSTLSDPTPTASHPVSPIAEIDEVTENVESS